MWILIMSSIPSNLLNPWSKDARGCDTCSGFLNVNFLERKSRSGTKNFSLFSSERKVSKKRIPDWVNSTTPGFEPWTVWLMDVWWMPHNDYALQIDHAVNDIIYGEPFLVLFQLENTFIRWRWNSSNFKLQTVQPSSTITRRVIQAR